MSDTMSHRAGLNRSAAIASISVAIFLVALK